MNSKFMKSIILLFKLFENKRRHQTYPDLMVNFMQGFIMHEKYSNNLLKNTLTELMFTTVIKLGANFWIYFELLLLLPSAGGAAAQEKFWGFATFPQTLPACVCFLSFDE